MAIFQFEVPFPSHPFGYPAFSFRGCTPNQATMSQMTAGTRRFSRGSLLTVGWRLVGDGVYLLSLWLSLKHFWGLITAHVYS